MSTMQVVAEKPQTGRHHLLASIKGRLIVSCQDYVETMIPAALDGGAACLRVNGPQAVRFARANAKLPVLACNKVYFPNSEVYITPSVRAAEALIEAGADMIALDARTLPRPRQTASAIVRVVHQAGCLAVADIGSLDEGIDAWEEGADVIATTFCHAFSPRLIERLTEFACRVLAEGNIDSPAKVKEATGAGAWAVCIGSAITRPHLLTTAFRKVLG